MIPRPATSKPESANRSSAKDLLVIAYYTTNSGYEQEIGNLVQSLHLHGLKYEVTCVASRGSWQANTQYKAEFIRSALASHVGGRLLYLDADAVVRSRPVLLESLHADIAVHYRRPPDIALPRLSGELLSGTIFLASNPRTLELVDRWIRLNREAPDVWDQVNLQRAIQETLGIEVVELPPEYTFIFDSMRRDFPEVDPVIEHFQASRRYKLLIA